MNDKEKIIEEMRSKIYKNMTLQRYHILQDSVFIGHILLHLNMIPVRDARLETAATNGKDIFFDMDWYMGLKDSERKFVLAHEIWHVVMMHMARRKDREPRLWNIAIDMEVNYIIKQNYGSKFQMPNDKKGYYPPPELEGKSAEEIYAWLLKQPPEQTGGGTQDQNESGSNGDKKNSGGNGDKKNSGKGNKISEQSSFGTGKNDKHFSQDCKDISDFQGEMPKDRWGEKGLDSRYNSNIASDIKESIRNCVVEAAQAQRKKGNMPAGVEAIIKKIEKPEIRWQNELARFVTVTIGDKRQYLPPARRGVPYEIYMQSRKGQEIRVCVAVDTSGSCLGDLPKFMGELNSLITSFGNYKLTVIYCDCEITEVKKYDSSEKPIDLKDFQSIKGGGGTSFVPPFEYAREKKLEFDCFIYFTDGYGDAPEKAPPYPVLWVLTKDGSTNFCDYGRKVRFRNNSKGM